MALNRQPVIAAEPMMRMPDEIPTANKSTGIRPSEPLIKPAHPISVSELPMKINDRQIKLFEVITMIRKRKAPIEV
jgi:hypothetical protein